MAVARLDEKNFASCGKDHSVCMWNITNDGVRLIAKGTGHSSYVGALAASLKFICSASKDGILKVLIYLIKISILEKKEKRNFFKCNALF